MQYFAQLDNTNTVIFVYFIDDEHCLDDSGQISEEVGIQYCKSFYGQDTVWKHTSYDGKFRGGFAGVGYTYSEEYDAFLPKKEHSSWVLNKKTFSWEPPIPCPEDLTEEQKLDGFRYEWDDEVVNWSLQQRF